MKCKIIVEKAHICGQIKFLFDLILDIWFQLLILCMEKQHYLHDSFIIKHNLCFKVLFDDPMIDVLHIFNHFL